MHKRYEGILSTWKIPLSEDHYCEIFVWNNRENYLAAHVGVDASNYGICTAQYYEYKKSGLYCSGKKFAEIHYLLERMGAGYAAHEIQHLVNYWCDFSHWDRKVDDEMIAEFAGNFTNKFWTSFYERFSSEVSRG